MRWSKLKQLVAANFAPGLKSRIALHSTVYGDSTCGHAWLVLDGDVIANFCSRAHYNRFGFILAPPEGYARRLGKRCYAAVEAALTHALPAELLRTRLDAEAGAPMTFAQTAAPR